MPPPMTLPNTVMSGEGCAVIRLARRPAPTRNRSSPRRTSSSAPCCVHSSRQRHEGHAGAHEVHVAGDRLDHQAGDLGPRAAKASSSCSTLLYSSTSVCCTTSGRHAGAGGVAEGGQARAGLDQQRVGVAVVAALELDDLAAAGGAARAGGWRSCRPRCPSSPSRTMSTLGTRPMMASASSTLALGGRAEAEAVARPSCTASSTAGWPWPRIIGPQEPM